MYLYSICLAWGISSHAVTSVGTWQLGHRWIAFAQNYRRYGGVWLRQVCSSCCSVIWDDYPLNSTQIAIRMLEKRNARAVERVMGTSRARIMMLSTALVVKRPLFRPGGELHPPFGKSGLFCFQVCRDIQHPVIGDRKIQVEQSINQVSFASPCVYQCTQVHRHRSLSTVAVFGRLGSRPYWCSVGGVHSCWTWGAVGS